MRARRTTARGGPTRLLRAALLACLALAACSHAPRPGLRRLVDEARCEDAERLHAHRPPAPGAVDDVRRALTTPLSWVATGAGYAGDVAVLTGGSVGVGLLVCSPVAALDAALGGHGDIASDCFGEVASSVMSSAGLPGIGAAVYRGTAGWRCPDRTRLAREALAVSTCYAARGAPGDALRAAGVLAAVRQRPRVWSCLPRKEQARIDAALEDAGRAAEQPEAGERDATW